MFVCVLKAFLHLLFYILHFKKVSTTFKRKLNMPFFYINLVSLFQNRTLFPKRVTNKQNHASINLYPTPRTERKNFGFLGSSSKYFLNDRIKLSIVRVEGYTS